MNQSASLLDTDTTQLLNALGILIFGILLALLLSRVFVWLLRKSKWDEKLAYRSKGKNASKVDKFFGRFIFWFFIIAGIFMAVGEVSGIQVVVDITERVDQFIVRMQSSLAVMFLLRILATFVISLLFVYLWRKIRIGRVWLAAKVDSYRQRRLKNLMIQDLEVLSRSRISRLIHLSIKYLSYLVYLLLFITYVSIIASIFPAARPVMTAILTPIWAEIARIISEFIHWLPNLFNLILICLVGYYLTRVARYFFHELEKGSIHIKGFYPV
jgi:hypothetical protein